MEKAQTQIISTYENEHGDKSVLTVFCTEDGKTGAVVAFPWSTKVLPPEAEEPENDIISRLCAIEASLEERPLAEAIILHRLLRNPVCDTAEMLEDSQAGALAIMDAVFDLLERANMREAPPDGKERIPF